MDCLITHCNYSRLIARFSEIWAERTPGFLLLFLLFVSFKSFSVEYTGLVKGFYVNNENVVLVRLQNSASQPQCVATGGWQFQFTSNTEYAKQWVSMLLASRMSDTEIKIGYNANANGRCDVRYIYYWE